MTYERNVLIKNNVNKLPLAGQFALTAVKLQILVAKHVMSGTPLEQVLLAFGLCPHLDATNGNAIHQLNHHNPVETY